MTYLQDFFKTAGRDATLKPLPYAYDALEPHMGRETVRLHHSKHQQAYVDGLNKASLELLRVEPVTRAHWESEYAFHWGGIYLHELFWVSMSPNGGVFSINDEIAGWLTSNFNSWASLEDQFTQSANELQGSGWVILYMTNQGIHIGTVQNHDHKALWDANVLLPIDMWEHSYYLDHRNDKIAYTKTILRHLVDWPTVYGRLRETS